MQVAPLPRNVKELLKRMREQWIVGAHAPVNVDGISHALSIVVRYDYSLDRNGSVGSLTFENGSPVITINPSQNVYQPRRCFTLAHEIGHYVLHSTNGLTEFIDSQQTMSRTASYWNHVESEANGFAAQLLMPKSLISTEGQTIIDIYKSLANASVMPVPDFVREMAAKFVVSNQTMEYRLISLGVLKS